NVVGHVEQPGPLLFVERYRKATQPVHRHAALLADLQRHAPGLPILQTLVLGAEPLEFSLHLIVSHAHSPTRARSGRARTESIVVRISRAVAISGWRRAAARVPLRRDGRSASRRGALLRRGSPRGWWQQDAARRPGSGARARRSRRQDRANRGSAPRRASSPARTAR